MLTIKIKPMFTIFLAPKCGEHFTQEAFEEFVSHSLVEAGLVPDLMEPAIAVIPDSGNALKVNGVVVAFNEKEPCLKAAFILKPYLRFETYTVPLNEALPLNCFRAIVHMRPLGDTVEIWKQLAQDAILMPITAVFFEYSYGVLAFGSMRQIEDEDVEAWQSAVNHLCHGLGSTSVIFETR